MKKIENTAYEIIHGTKKSIPLFFNEKNLETIYGTFSWVYDSKEKKHYATEITIDFCTMHINIQKASYCKELDILELHGYIGDDIEPKYGHPLTIERDKCYINCILVSVLTYKNGETIKYCNEEVHSTAFNPDVKKGNILVGG